MGFQNEKPVVPGQVIGARAINGFTRSIQDFSRSRLNPYQQDQGFWAKLTGNGPSYDFQQVTGAEVMGTILWTVIPDGLTGTGTANELNNLAGLNGLVVFLERYDFFGNYLFEYPRTGSGGGSVTVPGCPCTSSPRTINMVSSKPASNNFIFQSATLVYGPTPAPLLPVVLLANSYLSTATFHDPILNVPFFYFLTCTINSYVLTRVYPSSPFGSPFRDAVRYKWVPGFPGNTCSPFLMTNGQIFLGGDASCIVTLSG